MRLTLISLLMIPLTLACDEGDGKSTSDVSDICMRFGERFAETATCNADAETTAGFCETDRTGWGTGCVEQFDAMVNCYLDLADEDVYLECKYGDNDGFGEGWSWSGPTTATWEACEDEIWAHSECDS